MTVSDEHDSERTRPPLSGSGDGWLPPREQAPPHQWTPPGPPPTGSSYAAPADPRPSFPPGLQPYPVQQHRSATPERGRVSGWVWPLVSALALVIGVIGGVLGGAVYENLHDHSTEGQVSGGLADSGVESRAPLPAHNRSVASVAQRLLPSTVQVLAQYQGKKDGATGSGFVLDRSGHYITNNHVVADAVENDGPIEIVDQHGDKYTAKVVGRSPTYDLAVLYVKGGAVAPAGEPRAPRRSSASVTRWWPSGPRWG